MTFIFKPGQKSKAQGIGPGAGTKVGDRSPTQKVERRAYPRIQFTAGATAVEIISGAQVDARTTDLAEKGCYVDTMNPFPVGAEMEVRLTKDGTSFRAAAKVIYCQAGVGMGLLFRTVAPEQLATLQEWMNEARGVAPAPTHSLEKDERVVSEDKRKNEEHFALEELLVVMMRKGLLSEEEGEPILRRLAGSVDDPHSWEGALK